jgi:hypothetical protein
MNVLLDLLAAAFFALLILVLIGIGIFVWNALSLGPLIVIFVLLTVGIFGAMRA